MIKKIGEVQLNYKYYSGWDAYSDGNVEDELLQIVKDNEEPTFDNILRDNKKWELLYHLSQNRWNLLDWLPVNKTDTILEIGAGCGAMTGCLAKKAKHVTCIELSEKRSLINAYRNRTCDNIDIYIGNFCDIDNALEEKYDYVTLIGVLEYASLYFSTEDPFVKLLAAAKSCLKPGGKLVVAIENKLGMKYWAGCREDHTGRFFDSLEGYSGDYDVRTFSRKELDELLEHAGFESNIFYYPYPDYKFPSVIYSDEFLPGDGELQINVINFDKDRVLLFDESKVFSSVSQEGMFPTFANSFLVIARNGECE